MSYTDKKHSQPYDGDYSEDKKQAYYEPEQTSEYADAPEYSAEPEKADYEAGQDNDYEKEDEYQTG